MASNETLNLNTSTADYGNNQNAWKIVHASLYFIIFPPALLLNLIVAWICVHLMAKSSFMVYLKHLVVADLIMTLTFPIRGASDLPGASLGLRAFTCKVSSVIFYLGMNMSVILTGLISLDRYLKIVRSGRRFLCQNLFFSNVLSFFFWIALISSSTLPVIITTDQDPTTNSKDLCSAMRSKIGNSLNYGVITASCVIFWIVFALMVFCYTCIAKSVLESYKRSGSSNDNHKRKTQLQVFIILFIFLICYFPFKSVHTLYTIKHIKQNNTRYTASLEIGDDFTCWLAALNVCLDPIIYFFLCKQFRAKFWMTLCHLQILFPFFRENHASQILDTSHPG